MVIRAAALAMDFSRSFDRRRHRPSQARVRATPQRRGRPLKAPGYVGAFDDLNGPAPDGFQGVAQLWPGLAAIGKNRAQHGKPHGHGFQHIRRTVPVLEPGTVPHPSDQQAKRVGDDRALATLDPLAHVIAGNPAPFRGFHALAVEDTGGRARALRPSARRAIPTSARVISSSRPSVRQP